MRGTIRKHGVGWQYTVDIGTDPVTNNRLRKSEGGFKTKKECEAEMNKLIVRVEKGDYIEEKKTILAEYLTMWLETIEKKVSGNTHIFYKRIVDNILIPSLGNVVLFKLKPMHIENFLKKQRERTDINGTTLRHYYNTLNIALNQAMKWQLISNNVCLAVDPPKKAAHDIEILNFDEIEKLLTYLKNSKFKVLYIPVLLAVTCGMRRGEILGLKWDNVDLNEGSILIKDNYTKVGNTDTFTAPKTENSIRKIALMAITINELQTWKDFQPENEFVCTWDDGRLIRPDYITQQFSRIIKKINLPHVTFHGLRHSHATLLLQENVDPKIVSQRLGHSNISTTYDIYAHVTNEIEKKAVDKLDTLFKTKF